MSKIDLATALQIIFFLILLWLIVKSFISKNYHKGNFFGVMLWCIIFIILIVMYAFRFELESVKNKVLAVLIPSYAWVNETGQLIISRHQNGHFYLNAYAKNGQKIRFLIDTGASDVALTKEDAKKLGFNLSSLKYTKQYVTANGLAAAAPIRIPQLTIDKKIFYNIEGHVTSGDLDISLLGMSLIGKFKDFKITQDMLILSY